MLGNKRKKEHVEGDFALYSCLSLKSDLFQVFAAEIKDKLETRLCQQSKLLAVTNISIIDDLHMSLINPGSSLRIHELESTHNKLKVYSNCSALIPLRVNYFQKLTIFVNKSQVSGFEYYLVLKVVESKQIRDLIQFFHKLVKKDLELSQYKPHISVIRIQSELDIMDDLSNILLELSSIKLDSLNFNVSSLKVSIGYKDYHYHEKRK